MRSTAQTMTQGQSSLFRDVFCFLVPLVRETAALKTTALLKKFSSKLRRLPQLMSSSGLATASKAPVRSQSDRPLASYNAVVCNEATHCSGSQTPALPALWHQHGTVCTKTRLPTSHCFSSGHLTTSCLVASEVMSLAVFFDRKRRGLVHHLSLCQLGWKLCPHLS